MPPLSPAGAPATLLLGYGPWQAHYGQAPAYEHLNYLREYAASEPFGALPAVAGLPGELVGFELTRGWVEDLLNVATGYVPVRQWLTLRTLQVIAPQRPPQSPFAQACLAYFAQTLYIEHRGRISPFTRQAFSNLTPERILRAAALLAPFWPGQAGITEPAAAAAAMRDFLTVGPFYGAPQWANRLLHYACFEEPLSA